jgi:1-deoxy-D-xylulose-5-phosphate synthase
MSTIEIDTTGAALVADAAAVSLEPPCFDVRGLEAPVFEAPVFEVPGLETPGLETPDLGALSPGVLRSLSPVALVALAERIRGFLVHAVSVTGGHLGSNLGVVELTLALHRRFESPRDTIVWDTGHQAYVHKLVTGRADAFDGLRQRDGLSGYPSRTESEHDVVENSHASTALSYAYGLARARALSGDEGRTVAVVGDGALTGGLAYEALNNIGVSGAPVLIVLNDNGRSYAPTVSPLSTQAAPGGLAPAAFFESLGIEYTGPVDGHDLAVLEPALAELARHRGPVVLHVHTSKGRGYAPAEADDEKCLHDVQPFDPATGRAVRPAGLRSYTEAFGTALLAEAAGRPDVVAITAAMPGPTGLLRFAERFPERFFDVGIAEQHAVAAAAGMAMAGLRPVVAIYSTFLNRAFDQVYFDVGLHRLPVVFCLDRAGVTGDDGPSHHGLLDLSLLTKVPGMTVLCPSSYDEVGAMLRTALSITTGPVAIRWPKTEAPSGVAGLGLRARPVRAGTDVCLLGVGKLLAACEEAAEILAVEGVSASVFDVRCAAPLDPAMIDAARRHRAVVVVEDGVAEGGVGALVASALARAGASAPPVRCLGVPVAYVAQGRAADILAALDLDGPGIARQVLAGRASISRAGGPPPRTG